MGEPAQTSWFSSVETAGPSVWGGEGPAPGCPGLWSAKWLVSRDILLALVPVASPEVPPVPGLPPPPALNCWRAQPQVTQGGCPRVPGSSLPHLGLPSHIPGGAHRVSLPTGACPLLLGSLSTFRMQPGPHVPGQGRLLCSGVISVTVLPGGCPCPGDRGSFLWAFWLCWWLAALRRQVFTFSSRKRGRKKPRSPCLRAVAGSCCPPHFRATTCVCSVQRFWLSLGTGKCLLPRQENQAAGRVLYGHVPCPPRSDPAANAPQG